MVRTLLAAASLAAFAIPAAPAAADHPIGIGLPNGHPPQFDHHQRRFDHRFGRDGGVIWGGYELSSSYDDRDGRPDSGNDWWNDRPDRAYPRWVQEQRAHGSCDADRMWWSGSGWHC